MEKFNKCQGINFCQGLNWELAQAGACALPCYTEGSKVFRKCWLSTRVCFISLITCWTLASYKGYQVIITSAIQMVLRPTQWIITAKKNSLVLFRTETTFYLKGLLTASRDQVSQTGTVLIRRDRVSKIIILPKCHLVIHEHDEHGTVSS